MTGGRPLRIVVLAPLRFALRRPHAGGLESAVWSEVDALRRRGHEVTFVAPAGSDFLSPDERFTLPALRWPADAVRSDHLFPPSLEESSVPALSRALDALAADAPRYDVISNHCLHPLPLLRAPTLGIPMVTTLHTPVDLRFVAAHEGAAGAGSRFLSVSSHTRQEWARAGVPSRLLFNGVDPGAWPAGPGGDGLVWFGRIVPEKAPHLAVEVARRLGVPLTLAGRIGDRAYAEERFLPTLGGDVTYAGPLAPAELARLVGRSSVALSTPAWAEPFGLVAPEALMCGTPVVSFAVGGVPEIARRSRGMLLVPAGDVAAMTRAVALQLDAAAADPLRRARIRADAVREFSLDTRIAGLETAFAAATGARRRPRVTARAARRAPLPAELTA